eukprot:6579138-Alexandrium_andersonii.AAC.1
MGEQHQVARGGGWPTCEHEANFDDSKNKAPIQEYYRSAPRTEWWSQSCCLPQWSASRMHCFRCKA